MLCYHYHCNLQQVYLQKKKIKNKFLFFFFLNYRNLISTEYNADELELLLKFWNYNKACKEFCYAKIDSSQLGNYIISCTNTLETNIYPLTRKRISGLHAFIINLNYNDINKCSYKAGVELLSKQTHEMLAFGTWSLDLFVWGAQTSYCRSYWQRLYSLLSQMKLKFEIIDTRDL